MKVIKIKGMHCEACISLITMDLEDAGFKKVIQGVKLNDDNTGEVILNNITESDYDKIIKVINSLESYSVID